MRIDHVSVGGNDLGRMERSFAEAGMETVYGGPHSGGETKMSLLGFVDGSYIELISTVERGGKASLWSRQISENGGPCAWAIGVDDIAKEVAKARQVGIPASGPGDYSRTRPDGVLVEWQLGFLGSEEAGAVLPFMIKDKTPREYRVRPSPSVANGPIRGVGAVVIGVESARERAPLFRKMYGWGEPIVSESLWEGVRLASFEGTPVVLAEPLSSSWLSDRLRAFGPCPCAFLLDLEAGNPGEGYPLEPSREWFDGKRLAWLSPLKREGILIGLLSRQAFETH
jgi:hypothetical protein